MDEVIRPMRISDIPRVQQIEQASFFSPWTPSFFRRCLMRGCEGWILEIEGQVAGYVVTAHAPGISHVLNLCVAPERRRHGLGRKLLRHAIEIARCRSALSVILEVRASNFEARSLYHDEGFSEVGVRRGYYPSAAGREDAQIMCLQLQVEESETE